MLEYALCVYREWNYKCMCTKKECIYESEPQLITACMASHTCCKTYSLIIKVCIRQMLFLLLKLHKLIECRHLHDFDDFDNLIVPLRSWTEPLWLARCCSPFRAPPSQNQLEVAHESRHLLHFRSHASLIAHLIFNRQPVSLFMKCRHCNHPSSHWCADRQDMICCDLLGWMTARH